MPLRDPLGARYRFLRSVGEGKEEIDAMSIRESEPLTNAIPDVYYRLFDVVLDRGEGSYVYASDGRRWLDYSTGIGVTITGHAHPRVVKAVTDQAAKFLHCQLNVGLHEPAMRLCTRLSKLVGENYSCFLANTGSESIEGALKLARVVTKRPAFIAFEGGFHGRTMGALAVTSSRVTWRAGYEPLPSSTYFAPYCYPLRSRFCDPGDCKLGCIEQLKALFDKFVHPHQVAGIIVEPILGEGGYVVPSDGFLPSLRELCNKHGILLIIDEVQSGFGRTGKMFAYQHDGISPDIVCMSKGIASGLPLSALVARRDLMAQWEPGANGGTFNGNIVSCAAANATLDVIEEERLIDRAAELGVYLKDRLEVIAEAEPSIAEVRGRGLMVGVEIVRDGLTPDAGRTRAVRELCFDAGLLLISAGTYNNVIRFIPPLTTTREEIDWAVDVFARAVTSTRTEN
jgi:4-aminobutyrate aminotransferase